MTLPLFATGRFGEVAVARRDAGIAKAAKTSGELWQDLAFDALRAYLKSYPTFHVDAFATWSNGSWRSKAFGAVVQRAVRERLMEPTEEYLPSRISNMAPKRVFKSLVYRAVAP